MKIYNTLSKRKEEFENPLLNLKKGAEEILSH